MVGARGMRRTRITQVVAPGTYRHPEANGKKDPQGWYGEETLDVEAVHGMAPEANIVFVGPANANQDLDAAINHVVDRKLAQIVSNSYGFSSEQLPQGFIKPFEDTLIQAAIQGIGIYFSSGDNSDESQTRRLRDRRLAGVEPVGHRGRRHEPRRRREQRLPLRDRLGHVAQHVEWHELVAFRTGRVALRRGRRRQRALRQSRPIRSASSTASSLATAARAGRCRT